jgi:hypothetical protein
MISPNKIQMQKCFEEHAWSQVLSPSFTSEMDNKVHQFLFMASNFFSHKK